MSQETVRELLAQNIEETNARENISRNIDSSRSLSERGLENLRQNGIFNENASVTNICIEYVYTPTGESLSYVNLSYTDNTAYIAYIRVKDPFQNAGVATEMISGDIIPYCKNELSVSSVQSVAKAEEMHTVFPKVKFENPEGSAGDLYIYTL
jgi:RimJ/RimL family protein N-acetyltransferase